MRTITFLLALASLVQIPALSQEPEASQAQAAGATTETANETNDPPLIAQSADRTKDPPQTESAKEEKELPNPFNDPRDRIFYPGDTERPIPLFKKLAGNILLDQKEIWTSPFRMNRHNVGWWVGIGGATAALIATDRHTIDTFRNSQGQITWGTRLSRPGASSTLLPLMAGFYAYGAIAGDAKPREVAVLGGEALLDSLIVVSVLKPIAGRNRPNVTSSPEKAEFFDGGASFPSGHSTEIWAFASVIAHEYRHQKVVPILAYTLATTVSLSRFAAQQHFASDILAGSAMGWFIGRYVYQTHYDHLMHYQRRFPQIAPAIRPEDRSYGVSIAFDLSR